MWLLETLGRITTVDEYVRQLQRIFISVHYCLASSEIFEKDKTKKTKYTNRFTIVLRLCAIFEDLGMPLFILGVRKIQNQYT